MELFYVGRYSEKGSAGLSLCSLASDGQVKIIEDYEIENQSYICFSDDKKRLYSAIEKDEYKEKPGGGVAAYNIDTDGRLVFLNDDSTKGAAPCHLSVDHKNILYTANYTSGSLSIFSLNENGIGNLEKVIPTGDFGLPSKVFPGRQEKPHAHFIAPYKKTVWVCDLGLDLVIIFDENMQKLCHISTAPGSGPRHLAFHPTMPFVYVVCELSNEIYSFVCETSESGFDIRQTAIVSTLQSEESTCAAVKISPCGRYLLASNRSVNGGSISVMRLDIQTGIPTLTQIVQTGGLCPRDFAFNNKGDMVLCANQESDSIAMFTWEKEQGVLSQAKTSIKIGKPVCIVFL